MAGYYKEEWFLLLVEGLGWSHPSWEGILEEVRFWKSQLICALGYAVVSWEDDIAARIKAVGQGRYIHRQLFGVIETLFEVVDLQVEDDILQIGWGVEVAQIDLNIHVGVGGQRDADGGGVGGKIRGVDAGHVEGLVANGDGADRRDKCE